LKLVNYTVTVAPIGATAAAWGGICLWTRLGVARRFGRLRVVLAALLLAVVSEGAVSIATLEAAAASTTPYYVYIGQVRRYLPEGAHVLGLHNYWFGLEDFEYLDITVPLAWASNWEAQPLSFDQALDRAAPDAVLVDQRIRAYFDLDHEKSTLFQAWLNRHDGHLIGRVD